MRTLLLINVSANSGSTGRIAEEIGQAAMECGYDSFFGYGREGRESKSTLIRIGDNKNIIYHGLESMLLDNHGFGSRAATKKFIKEVERIQPDVIHLHNIHGYYLNVKILFDYLAIKDIPVVWTLHDCWPFTGHCSHYMRFECEKWKDKCHDCPNYKGYPKSLFWDRSAFNYSRKKGLFTSLKNATIVCPSHWLEADVRQSFLRKYDVRMINNGIDISVFHPKDPLAVRTNLQIPDGRRVVLGVASVWTAQKGLDDFIVLRKNLGDNYDIVLIGLSESQIHSLPNGIIGVNRTNSVQELADYYSLADVFVNPTYVDTFPTTNIEALACGTPVVTYRTGGSPEAIDESTGIVVERGDLQSLKDAIVTLSIRKKDMTDACRNRAVTLFNKKDRYFDYVELYNELTR